MKKFDYPAEMIGDTTTRRIFDAAMARTAVRNATEVLVPMMSSTEIEFPISKKVALEWINGDTWNDFCLYDWQNGSVKFEDRT